MTAGTLPCRHLEVTKRTCLSPVPVPSRKKTIHNIIVASQSGVDEIGISRSRQLDIVGEQGELGEPIREKVYIVIYAGYILALQTCLMSIP
jgi:hydrogenase maturation factor